MIFSRWDETPLYRQLAAVLRRRINAGELKPGDRLPTEADLAATYGVSRETVRAALQLLRDEGLIRKYRGRGSYVPPREKAPGEPEAPPS